MAYYSRELLDKYRIQKLNEFFSSACGNTRTFSGRESVWMCDFRIAGLCWATSILGWNYAIHRKCSVNKRKVACATERKRTRDSEPKMAISISVMMLYLYVYRVQRAPENWKPSLWNAIGLFSYSMATPSNDNNFRDELKCCLSCYFVHTHTQTHSGAQKWQHQPFSKIKKIALYQHQVEYACCFYVRSTFILWKRPRNFNRKCSFYYFQFFHLQSRSTSITSSINNNEPMLHVKPLNSKKCLKYKNQFFFLLPSRHFFLLSLSTHLYEIYFFSYILFYFFICHNAIWISLALFISHIK